MPTRKKNIVITGGARGIGRVTARHLALLGHNLFLIDINEAELVHTVNSHIPQILSGKTPDTPSSNGAVNGHLNGALNGASSGPLIGYKVCDLRDPAAIRATIQAAASFFPYGQIDVVVNNAGIARAQFSAKRTMEDPEVFDDWNAYLAVNLTAPFLVSQACLPFMKGKEDPTYQPGEALVRPEAAKAAAGYFPEESRRAFARPELQSRCIIHISSFRSKQSEPNCEGYAASKAGLLGLTQAMAISGGQWGIRCNTILPGFTFVDHECKAADESGGEMWWTQGIEGVRHKQHPTGRIGYGEDVAEAVEWLMGAGFVTGQEIVIDGGISKVKHEAA